MKKGFTLLEILVVITLLIILAVTLILLFNPLVQINKAYDGKRKTELSTMRKVLEDWYNDKNCYPKPKEICYNAQEGKTTCNICGNKSTSPDFSPYLKSLPCDLHQSESLSFFYEVNDVACPSLYRIYTVLSNKTDPIITLLGCQNGCGPYGNCNYNYGVASPNTSVEYCTSITPTIILPTPTVYYVGNCPSYNPLYIHLFQQGQWQCNICGSYNECLSSYPNEIFYIDAGGGRVTGCTQACIKTVISTPTPTIPVPTPTTSYVGNCSSYGTFYIINNNACNICGNYNDCQASHPNNIFYINTNCSQACVKN